MIYQREGESGNQSSDTLEHQLEVIQFISVIPKNYSSQLIARG